MSMSQLRGTPNYIWSLHDVLGQGATGAVYRGRHKKTGELYAIKTFNQISHMRPLEVQMREFDVLKKLTTHQNIVKLLAIEEESSERDKVLVMELCTHGSLYTLLDDPSNAHGLDDDAFFHVLRDVAAGMQHLRENGIVHRDIKPGNIMKYEEPESGRFIYKLIDFGAARELEEDGHFMSLYGTEEYLHPDLYQRAVLRRPMSKKQFGVGVDLWSLGVTFYHAATGHLPFRPYGGRKNKEIMFKITTEKQSGIISGVQNEENGPIEWSRELPKTCRLSQGAKELITPMLAGLMECDTTRMLDFPKFFEHVTVLKSKQPLHVFNVCNSKLLTIYLGDTERFSKFQELITAQTEVIARDQMILFENLPIDFWVEHMTEGKKYPKTSLQNPMILYYNIETQKGNLDSPEITKYPKITIDGNLEGDVGLAKTCAGIAYLIKRNAEECIKLQAMLEKSAKMYLLMLRKDLEKIRDFIGEFYKRSQEVGKRVHSFVEHVQQSLNMLSLMKNLIHDNVSRSIENTEQSLKELGKSEQETFTQLDRETARIQRRMNGYYEKIVIQRELCKMWLEPRGCLEPETCINKLDFLCRQSKQTLDDFRRDRSLKKLSYNEEQIHKFDKSKLSMNGTKAMSVLQGHCFPNLKRIFRDFGKWYTVVYNVRKDLTEIEKSINQIADRQASLLEALDRDQIVFQTSFEEQVKQVGSSAAGLPRQPQQRGSSSSPLPHGDRSVVTGFSKHLFAEVFKSVQLLKGEAALLTSAVKENGSLLRSFEQLDSGVDPGPPDLTLHS